MAMTFGYRVYPSPLTMAKLSSSCCLRHMTISHTVCIRCRFSSTCDTLGPESRNISIDERASDDRLLWIPELGSG